VSEDKRERPDSGEEKSTPIAPRDEGADVTAGHEPPKNLQRGHQPPASDLELGHPPAEGVVVMQVGEMHSPPVEAPPPTAPPPKPDDAAQSVRPPSARQDTPSPAAETGSSGDADND
jgi:hypothetical protein